MSVPLDRLYHFLADCVNHDLVIYRWFPHGSRKLQDLKLLNTVSDHQILNLPIMICHDQELLIWNYYSKNCLKQATIEFYRPGWFYHHLSDTILDYHVNTYLRSVISCANKFDKVLLLHSEQKSSQVDIFSKNGFVPVYYWSHAVIALDWYRFAKHDPKLNFRDGTFVYDFLIYNRAWSGTREYRLSFVEKLLENNLGDCTNTKFSQFDDGLDYRMHQFVNPKFTITDDTMHEKITSNTAGSDASADYNNDDYLNSAIEIVLETLFDDSRWHLTEKTLRPIACGKPFILAATAGSLEYLRSYGFKTFTGFIDESYDTITDSHARLDAVVLEMKRISQLDTGTKQQLFTDLHQIAKYNQHHFFNNLFDIVIEEYKTNLDRAMSAMYQHQTGMHRKKIQKLLQQ